MRKLREIKSDEDSHHQKSTTGVSVAKQKGLMSFTFFKKQHTHLLNFSLYLDKLFARRNWNIWPIIHLSAICIISACVQSDHVLKKL